MTNTPAINTTNNLDLAKILDSKYGGLAGVGVALLAGLGIVEISSAISKGIEKGCNIEAGSEKYGVLKFTVPATDTGTTTDTGATTEQPEKPAEQIESHTIEQ